MGLGLYQRCTVLGRLARMWPSAQAAGTAAEAWGLPPAGPAAHGPSFFGGGLCCQKVHHHQLPAELLASAHETLCRLPAREKLAVSHCQRLVSAARRCRMLVATGRVAEHGGLLTRRFSDVKCFRSCVMDRPRQHLCYITPCFAQAPSVQQQLVLLLYKSFYRVFAGSH